MRKAAVKRNPPYHVGDKVRIIVPKFVVRVGYPKLVKDYEAEAERRSGPALEEAMRAAGVRAYARDSKHWKVMVREIAYLMARADGFGGKERAIFWDEKPEYERATATVREIRTVHTGTYRSPWSYTNYDGEYESDSGGLRDEVRHRILRVDCLDKDRDVEQRVYEARVRERMAGNHCDLVPARESWRGWEIPTYHVERVEENRRPA